MDLDIEQVEVPAGWTKEALSYAPLVVIGRPADQGGGFVTIDVNRRVFGPGGGYPNERHICLPMNYAGRGWKQKIVADAVAWLKAV